MSLAASDPALIGVDWGTSSFRAFLMDGAGAVLDHVSGPDGILSVEGGAFEPVLWRHLGAAGWSEALPIVVSGMITSRSGWVETPYVDLPAGAEDLARALSPYRTEAGRVVHFVTGVCAHDGGVPDVIRGEETQIIGAVAAGLGDGLFVMPGTHSKMLWLEAGRIMRFATYMTGEVYAALSQHTIIARSIGAGRPAPEAFERGVIAARDGEGGLLHLAFSARSLSLFGELAEADTADYLSGLLIGTEIRDGVAKVGAAQAGATIVGRSDLAQRYVSALGLFGIAAKPAPDALAALGHHTIAKAGGLL